MSLYGPDKSDLFSKYQVMAEVGDHPTYTLFKVLAPDGKVKLWKKIELSGNTVNIETRLLNTLEKLAHPNLNSITNHFWFQDKGLLFIETDYPLMTLRQRLNECREVFAKVGRLEEGMGIPVEELLEYMSQAADGIDFLNTPQHPYYNRRIAIYHRALCPDALVLFEDNGTKVCRVSDFGLAKPVAETNDAVRHSLGLTNFDYAPPEFDEGLTAVTSDQYSLACSYYELRTGQLPFQGSLLQRVQAQLAGTPNLSLVEEAERQVIQKALSRDPMERFPDCRTFIEQLRLSISQPQSILDLMGLRPTTESALGASVEDLDIFDSDEPTTTVDGELAGAKAKDSLLSESGVKLAQAALAGDSGLELQRGQQVVLSTKSDAKVTPTEARTLAASQDQAGSKLTISGILRGPVKVEAAADAMSSAIIPKVQRSKKPTTPAPSETPANPKVRQVADLIRKSGKPMTPDPTDSFVHKGPRSLPPKDTSGSMIWRNQPAAGASSTRLPAVGRGNPPTPGGSVSSVSLPSLPPPGMGPSITVSNFNTDQVQHNGPPTWFLFGLMLAFAFLMGILLMLVLSMK